MYCSRKKIVLATTMNLYMAVVFFLVCETWNTYGCHIKQLEQFYNMSIGTIMNKRWNERVVNQKVLNKAGSKSNESMLLSAQVC